jgi:hypothetical protein
MIYFVTEAWLKGNTAITANIDTTDIMPWVKTNAEIWTRKILGINFYNDLLVKYNAQTLSADEIIIVEYIQPSIAWRAAVDCVYGLSRQLKNKGLQSQFGENSESVDLPEVQFGMAHYEQKATYYEGILIDYLKENKDLYAEFISTANKTSIIPPIEDQTSGRNIMII